MGGVAVALPAAEVGTEVAEAEAEVVQATQVARVVLVAMVAMGKQKL